MLGVLGGRAVDDGPDAAANDWCVGVYVCVIDDDEDDDDNDGDEDDDDNDDDDDDDDDLLGQ